MTSSPSDVRAPTPFWPRVARLFASVDLRSLALFRIALGIALAADLVPRLRYAEALYSNDGVLTNHFSLFRPLAPYQFSLYVSASSSRDVTVVFWLTLLVYLLFTIGYRTRLFQIIAFICVTSLHSRNLLTELPSDVPLHLLLAWSLVMPLGARFSIDAVRRSLRDSEERSPGDLNVATPREGAFTSIAVLGFILQLSVMHLVPALRQDGPTWRDGTALYYALRQNFWVTNLGVWVAEHASLDGLKRLTFAFRFTEMAIGVLVLVPLWLTRRAAAVLLLVFHLASRALWNFGPYEWVMIAGLPMLLTARDWDAFGRWYLRRKPALTVYFDVDCGICFAICRLLRRLDSLGRFTFVANTDEGAPEAVKAQAAETVVVREEETGKTFTRSRAMASVLASLPLGIPFGLFLRLPGISWLADRIYDKVAKNRAAISVWFGFDACGVPREHETAAIRAREPIPELERAMASTRELAAGLFLAVSCAALVARWNDDTKPHGFEAALYPIVAYPRLFQDWKLFAPDPPERQFAFVVDAQTGRGTRIDPLTGQTPLEMLDVTKLDPRSRPPTPLLAAYFTNITQMSRAIYVDELRNYLQRVGDLRELGDRFVWFNVSWSEAVIPPPKEMPQPTTLDIIPVRRITSRP